MVGRDKLPYADYPSFPADSLLDTNIMINSTISDASKGAIFFDDDINIFFLGSFMKDSECMRIGAYINSPDTGKTNSIHVRHNVYVTGLLCYLSFFSHPFSRQ